MLNRSGYRVKPSRENKRLGHVREPAYAMAIAELKESGELTRNAAADRLPI